MGLDSRNKRASALGFALAALVVLPAPDATINQGDRQQVAFSYAGILAGAAIVAEPDIVTVNAYFSRSVTLEVGVSTSVTLEAGLSTSVTVEVER